MVCLAECHILDVGQGSSNVILLGEGRAIVVDCASSASFPALKLLQKCAVSFIEVLVMTHNDADHCQGAAAVLGQYADRIGRIYLLQDRDASRMTFAKTLELYSRSGKLHPDVLIERLEISQNGKAKLLWEEKPLQMQLKLLYPALLSNLGAQRQKSSNATSAVLALEVPKGRIVFAGDCEVSGWQAIHTGLQNRRLACDVIVVPHHGGAMGDAVAVGGVDPFVWLYDVVVQASVGVISVGTVNTHGHPHPAAIEAIVGSGAAVMCTQITSKCCDDLEAIRPGVVVPGEFSLSSTPAKLTHGGRPKNVACAGSVIAEIGDQGVTVPSLNAHRVAVRANTRIKPLCR